VKDAWSDDGEGDDWSGCGRLGEHRDLVEHGAPSKKAHGADDLAWNVQEDDDPGDEWLRCESQVPFRDHTTCGPSMVDAQMRGGILHDGWTRSGRRPTRSMVSLASSCEPAPASSAPMREAHDGHVNIRARHVVHATPAYPHGFVSQSQVLPATCSLDAMMGDDVASDERVAYGSPGYFRELALRRPLSQPGIETQPLFRPPKRIQELPKLAEVTAREGRPPIEHLLGDISRSGTSSFETNTGTRAISQPGRDAWPADCRLSDCEDGQDRDESWCSGWRAPADAHRRRHRGRFVLNVRL